VSLDIIVRGRPAPQGSKRAVPVFEGKGESRQWKANRQIEMSPHVHTWRGDVKKAAEDVIEATGHVRFEGPVIYRMVFTVNRPKSVSRRRRLRPSTMPDMSKLLRATEDALTAAGVWRDDAQVVDCTRLAKVFVGEDPEALDVPGARIWIEEITEGGEDGSTG
jgi:Holliday junction resolvase RusA-like endonuclease